MAKITVRKGMGQWLEHSHKLLRSSDSQVDKPNKIKLKLTQKQRAIIREKFGGRCSYCGCDLPEKGWHADHAEPVMRYGDGHCHYPENDTIENIMPSCRSCNIYKNCADIESFRQIITRQLQNSIHRTQSLRAAQRFGKLSFDLSPVVFWFETYGKIRNEKTKAEKV
ncbi:HNH endonuclease [Xenorhabdus szentirmaii]|uniref:HNH endonuclease n=1 Tax=Xenorhabdus szentirmaii TaxID=290112 RepID=UPI000C06071A|nr:HNH endonuclease signature motif containing protein [Xenorhabdus szentirmaii]PHM42366.1 HNH endonuclease [Xenorhabdus szentirmaii]